MNKLLKRRRSIVRLANGLKAYVEHHGLDSLFDALREQGYERSLVRSIRTDAVAKKPSVWRKPTCYVANHKAPTWAYNDDLGA